MTIPTRDQTITVNLVDGIVTVDGEGYSITDLPPTPGVTVLQWQPDRKVPGTREGADACGFHEFALIEPYLACWARAKKVAEKRDRAARRKARKDAKAAEDAQRAAHERAAAARSEAERHQADAAAMHTALASLSRTDHEVIKAMETKLAAEGLMSSETLQQRQAWRETVKAERKRLQAAGENNAPQGTGKAEG